MKRSFAIALCGVVGALTLLLTCAAPPDGKAVFVASGCARCHAINGAGTAQGPRLEDLQNKWTSESLEAFLIDPPAYAKDNARLQAYTKKYTTPMPKVEIAPARRKVLVEYLLREHATQPPTTK